MIVIGNDLVNLKNEEHIRTMNREGFLKFFTQEELDVVKKENASKCLACLWAIKESAYKCVLKLGYKVAFSPKKYKIKTQIEENKMLGTVSYGDEIFHVKCIEDGEFVRCVVSNDFEVVHRIKSLHLKNSPAINEQIECKISKFTQNNNIIFKKNPDNIPVIINDDKTKFLEISLSKEGELYYLSVLPEWLSFDHLPSNNYATL